jgi:putative phosphoribosyl transferase
MPFADRTDAGNRLANVLTQYRGKDVVVLALARGGVDVALPIARHLEAPLDLLLVRKIGVPSQPEVAMGAIVDGQPPVTVRNEDIIRHALVSDAQFEAEAMREFAEIERRKKIYSHSRPAAAITGRIAIVVDDGIATGATLKAALKGLQAMKPQKIVIAVPIAPAGMAEDLQTDVDDVVCLEPLSNRGAISVHYRHFPQLDDRDVIATLDAAAAPR